MSWQHQNLLEVCAKGTHLDTFDFSQLTTEPTAPVGPGIPGGHVKAFDGYDGLLLPAVQMDDLAVDPNNPNTDVDGRDFLVWQRGNATPDSVPVGEDGGLSGDQLLSCCCPLSKTMVCCSPLSKTTAAQRTRRLSRRCSTSNRTGPFRPTMRFWSPLSMAMFHTLSVTMH